MGGVYPGADRNWGEELEDAVIREVIEETGIIPGLGGTYWYSRFY